MRLVSNYSNYSNKCVNKIDFFFFSGFGAKMHKKNVSGIRNSKLKFNLAHIVLLAPDITFGPRICFSGAQILFLSGARKTYLEDLCGIVAKTCVSVCVLCSYCSGGITSIYKLMNWLNVCVDLKIVFLYTKMQTTTISF